VVPLETLAGQDLLQIHTKHQETGVAKRRTLQAKFTSMRNVQTVVQPVNAHDPSTINPEAVNLTDGHAADGDEESKEEDDLSKPADVAIQTDAAEGDKVTEEPRPQSPGPQPQPEVPGAVADVPPIGPEQNALCDGCAVRVDS
jgi:hypothetical protein